MNARTFNTKELLMFEIPTIAVDLVIHIFIYRLVCAHFNFVDPADYVMLRPRTLYFLVVGYLIAVAVYPIRFFKRGVTWKFVPVRAFFQTFITLSIFAISVFVLFGNFAGRLFLQDGVAVTVAVTLWHSLFKLVIEYARRVGRNKIHVVVIGTTDNTGRLLENLQHGRDFNDYKVVACFGDDLDKIDDYLNTNKVHAVYCGLNPAVREKDVNHIIRTCENLFIDFFYVPNMDGYLKRSMTFSELGGVTLVQLREEPLANPVNALVKRFFDVLLSGLFLVTIFPLILVFVTVGTKFSSPGPVFFKQKRTGYKGKPFTMYKFRSMRINSEADTLQATKDDPRTTRFGSFLRKSSLDEIPQFINVLIGDMSLIGPRPHMEHQTEVYTSLIDEYLVRHMVKPGLTGWAQVSGCRGETRTTAQMEDRVRHDIWYIEHWSVLLDIRIFFKTIFQILKGDGQAY